MRSIRRLTFWSLRCIGSVPMLNKWVRGNVVILMLHEVHRDAEAELMTGTSVALLEQALEWLRANGWEFVTLDEALARAAFEDRPHSCVVLTFDDGYRDLALTALPVLERFDAPFMMYVPTGALTRTMPSWWLGVRELVRVNDRVVFNSMRRSFCCADYRSKLRTLSCVSRWIHQDYRRVAALISELGQARISLAKLNDVYFLSEHEFKELARHPLASVGGHTVSHPALATLGDTAARQEVAENRKYLEALTGDSIRHFAYPYGTTASFGSRDQQIVRKCGFYSAVTARKDQVSRLAPTPFSLPRIPLGGRYGTKESFAGTMSGIKLLSQTARVWHGIANVAHGVATRG